MHYVARKYGIFFYSPGQDIRNLGKFEMWEVSFNYLPFGKGHSAMRNFLLQLAICCGVLVCIGGCSHNLPDYYAKKDPLYMIGLKQFWASDTTYITAISAYQELLDKYPMDAIDNETLYNLGFSYFKERQYDSASIYLIIILDRYSFEKIPDFKQKASDLLSKVYYQQGKYDLSLKYLLKSDHEYQSRRIFCGNDNSGCENFNRYSDVYRKVGDKRKELEYLLYSISCSYCDNSETLLRLKALLHGKKHLLSELEDALTRIERGDGIEGIYYSFTFLNTTMWINKCNGEAIQSEEEAMNVVKTSDFYATIKSLE